MANRKKDRPYHELGEEIAKLRFEKFPTRKAFFDQMEFSFSYSSYCDFEKGSILPSPEILEEICKSLKVPIRELLLIWAKCQMPKNLKSVFEIRASETKPKKPDQTGMTPTRDSTWYLGPTDHKLLENHPWVWELVLALLTSFPKEIRYENFKVPSKNPPKKLLKQILRPWIHSGYIKASENGLSLRFPHAYLPQSSEWKRVRYQNHLRAVQEVVREATDHPEKNEHFIQLIHRTLTHAQAQKWKKEFDAVVESFWSDEYVGAAEEKTYVLALDFGPRSLIR